MIPLKTPKPLVDLKVFLSKRKQTLGEWLVANKIDSKDQLTQMAVKGSHKDFGITEELVLEMHYLIAPAVEAVEAVEAVTKPGRKKYPLATS